MPGIQSVSERSLEKAPAESYLATGGTFSPSGGLPGHRWHLFKRCHRWGGRKRCHRRPGENSKEKVLPVAGWPPVAPLLYLATGGTFSMFLKRCHRWPGAKKGATGGQVGHR